MLFFCRRQSCFFRLNRNIAFVTVVGLMVGFYYNLQSTGTKITDIFIFESIFITMVISIIIWLIYHINEGD